jgi:hypothetical protein
MAWASSYIVIGSQFREFYAVPLGRCLYTLLANAILVMEQETGNEERKEKGEALAGGESSAEYMISKSEKESQLPESTKKISPTTNTKNPTTESTNVEMKERGEALSGGESSAEYMASRAGEGEGRMPDSETEKKDYTDYTETIGDKMKAGAKALKNKVQDPDRSLKSEYEKEKPES